MKRFAQMSGIAKQRGAALLVMAVVIIMTLSVVYLSQRSANKTQQEKTASINAKLMSARDGLMGIALSWRNANFVGRLPYPDRPDDPLQFDGRGDCVGAPTAMQLIGRFPFRGDDGCGAANEFGLNVGESINPLQNPNALHYVVSSNLSNANLLNPVTVLASPNWLTVYDVNGAVLAQRAAFVVIHPGNALAGQNRASATADAAQFLDQITIPVQGTINHADVNSNPNPFGPRFVVAPAGNTFNDTVVYMSAEEFLRKIEWSYLGQVQRQIRALIPPAPAPASYPADITTDAAWTGVPVNWRTNWTYQVRPDCITGVDVTGCGQPGGIEYPPASGLFHDAVVFSNLAALGFGGIGQFFAFP